MTKRLTADQVRTYNDQGYVLVPGLFPAEEAALFRREAHDLIERLSKIRNVNAAWDSARANAATAHTIVQHCHDVQFYSALFARMLLDPRLTGAMADLIGPNVQLHHCKMFIKPPEKGAPFPMHQDHDYFPHQRHSMAAAIVHFDDAPIEKGCVRVYPGSHKLGPLKPDNPKDNSLSPERYPLDKATPCPARAGDVLFFNYLTIHGSGVNNSTEARTTCLVQFRDPTDPPTIRAHESRGQGMMLHGIDPSGATTKPLSEGKTPGMMM